ncbi:MAG: cyclic nucleotide-binding domain-containing protein [Archangium sp.]
MIFPTVGAETREVLLKSATELQLTRGFVLTREGERGDDLYFLVSGELAVKRGGRLLAMLEGPRLVGLTAALDEEPRSASLEVLSDAVLIRIRGEAFRDAMNTRLDLAQAVVRELQSDLRDAWNQQERDRQSLDDFFVSPSARLVPGPYVAQLEVCTFVMRESSVKLKSLLPPGCTPLPGAEETWLLLVSHFTDVQSESPSGFGRRFSYREVSPFIPCVGPDLLPALFCPELYPDNYLAILLGRELYGFPKRMGRFEVGEHHVSLAVGHQLALRTEWSNARTCTAAELGAHLTGTRLVGPFFGVMSSQLAKLLWPRVPVLVRKQIPEASSLYERSLHIDELVSIPFELSNVSGFAVLEKPEVRFLSDAFPLGGDTLLGYRQHMGFKFGAGEVLRDYRERGEENLTVRERVGGLLGTLARRVRS